MPSRVGPAWASYKYDVPSARELLANQGEQVADDASLSRRLPLQWQRQGSADFMYKSTELSRAPHIVGTNAQILC